MKWFLGTLLIISVTLAALFAYGSGEQAELEAQFPPIGQRMPLDGFELHYLDVGAGPTVALLHGAGTNLRDFTSSIVNRLVRDCRVVVFDRPGHGWSTYPNQRWMNPAEQAAAIRQTLRNLGIEHAIWLGHSWAGSVVMAALLDYPNEVTGGVLLSGATYDWKGGVDWPNHVADIPVLGPLFTHTILMPAGQLLMDRSIAAAFAPNMTTPEYRVRTGIDLALRPSQFTISGREVRLLSDFLATQSLRYRAITQPVLMIHGREDEIVPARNHSHKLIKVLPQATLRELPQTGHAPHHAHPDVVAREVARFGCSP